MVSASFQCQFKSVQYSGMQAGPHLIVTGAVHGNETCGTTAILRVIDEIERGELAITKGSVTFVPVANPMAYAQGTRIGERNLNRKLIPNDDPQDFEDVVANWLCPLLARHDVLLDLHSFSAGGEAFVMVGPRNNEGPVEPFTHAASERALALRLGVRRFVDGWLSTYARGVQQRVADSAVQAEHISYGVGTTEYMRSQGGYALTLECGQHADPAAPLVAYRAILNTLAQLGLVNAPAPKAQTERDALSMVSVHDKRDAGDTFSAPWQSFDRLAKGQQIGTYADGSVASAPFDCVILFPDAEARAGNEWYYLARANPDFENGPAV
jgi:predicted deacylase